MAKRLRAEEQARVWDDAKRIREYVETQIAGLPEHLRAPVRKALRGLLAGSGVAS